VLHWQVFVLVVVLEHMPLLLVLRCQVYVLAVGLGHTKAQQAVVFVHYVQVGPILYL
jgi:hypothetical protein